MIDDWRHVNSTTYVNIIGPRQEICQYVVYEVKANIMTKQNKQKCFPQECSGCYNRNKYSNPRNFEIIII